MGGCGEIYIESGEAKCKIAIYRLCTLVQGLMTLSNIKRKVEMTEDGKDNGRNETLETLKLEYKEVHAYWRTLTDIRFKLLAFVPTLTGLCVTFIPKTHQPLEAFAIGLLGFIATLGITFYDQRNSELYNASIERAKFLECEMKFKATRPIKFGDDINVGGIFRLRPDRRRTFLGIFMYHDRGLSMVYASALGAWLFIMINSILKLIFLPLTFSLLLAALLAIVIYSILQIPERYEYLFSMDTKFEEELKNNSNEISKELKEEFEINKFPLPANADAKETKGNKKWVITAKKKVIIEIKKKEGMLDVYRHSKLLNGAKWSAKESGP